MGAVQGGVATPRHAHDVTGVHSTLALSLSCVIFLLKGVDGASVMRYVMMRLFLVRRDEGTLFGNIPVQQSRQAYIQNVFRSEIHFDHYGNSFVFEPFPSPENNKIIGVIGKQRPITISGPPEEKFAHHDISNWDTANVLIDTSGNDDGQKVAMQPVLGHPPAIFKALVERINEDHPSSEWRLTVNPITTHEHFWSAADRYRGHISEIDFQFAVPNIWGAQSETERALRELKVQNNAQEVEVKIKNKDGKLNPDSERVRESVEYVTKGGGTAQLKDENQAEVYNSDTEEHIVSTPADPDPPIQESDEGAIRSLIRQLFGV